MNLVWQVIDVANESLQSDSILINILNSNLQTKKKNLSFYNFDTPIKSHHPNVKLHTCKTKTKKKFLAQWAKERDNEKKNEGRNKHLVRKIVSKEKKTKRSDIYRQSNK